MNSLFKKAAISAACALCALGMAGSPILAEEESGQTSHARPVVNVEEKIAVTDSESPVPVLLMNMSLSSGTPSDGEYAGNPSDLETYTKQYSQDQYYKDDQGNWYLSCIDSIEQKSGYKYPHAGIYVYSIHEGMDAFPGLKNTSDETLTLKAYVNDDGIVDGFVVYNPDGTKAGSTGGTDGMEDTVRFDCDYVTYRLVVNKTIAGTYANKNLVFNFDVTLPENNEDYIQGYPYKFIDANGKAFWKDGGTFSTTLGNSQELTVTGLAEGNYTVTETADPNYTPSASINGTPITLNDASTGERSITDNNTVAYTNTYSKDGGVIPTGLDNPATPYVILAGVIAILVLVYFLIRRKSKKA